MNNLVKLSKDNDVAIITIDNPPVNALSPGVPEGIGEAIDQINQDSSVKAAVVIGGGKTFIAGADIKEFGKMTSGKTLAAPDCCRYCSRLKTQRSRWSWRSMAQPSAADWKSPWPDIIAWLRPARRSVSRK